MCTITVKEVFKGWKFPENEATTGRSAVAGIATAGGGACVVVDASMYS